VQPVDRYALLLHTAGAVAQDFAKPMAATGPVAAKKVASKNAVTATMTPAPSADEIYRLLSTAVDVDFYREINPDLAAERMDPIRHYAESGWREGRDPAPWFSSQHYLAAYPDVATAGWNPLCHYLLKGRHEGREIVRSKLADTYLVESLRRGAPPVWRFEVPDVAEPETVGERPTRADERAIVAAEFDAVFYLGANPDVVALGVDPLDHFVSTGWREGRDPNPFFSVNDYLEAYPDIGAADANPFAHYLRAGRAEGRIARNELGFRYEIIKRLVPLDARIAAVEAASMALETGSHAALIKGLAQAKTGLNDLHVTVSHDDYTTNTGGVQLCLQREGAQIAALGRDHLHLYPAKPWPVVRLAGEPGPLGVLLNGQPLGVFTAASVAAALGEVAGAASGGQRSFAIHSLLGHSADETVEILAAAGLSAGYFWLHDFASLCAGYHLFRNEVQDCAAPPPDSAACGICVFGPWRARHLSEHEQLFRRLALTVASPSQAALDLWKARWSFPTMAEVVAPLASLKARGGTTAAPPVRAGKPLRFAYLGMPSAHKGWPIFQDLVLRHAGDPRYEFLHLGGRTPGGLPLDFHKVVVTDETPRAMQDAVESLEVDVAMIWSLCRETFSFTTYEAVAAGAAVITGPDSGNIAAFVAGGGHGLVLEDEAALSQALEQGAFAPLARSVRNPRLADLEFSGLTVDLMEGAR